MANKKNRKLKTGDHVEHVGKRDAYILFREDGTKELALPDMPGDALVTRNSPTGLVTLIGVFLESPDLVAQVWSRIRNEADGEKGSS